MSIGWSISLLTSTTIFVHVLLGIDGTEIDDEKSSNINKSYVMGYSDDTGWDGHYYFTYFGQFNRSSLALPIIEVVFVCILTFLVVLVNVGVLVIMFTTRSLSNGNNYFIGNMSVAAFLYPMTMPVIAVTRITETWVFSRVSCGLLGFSQLCGAVVSVWTMTLISIERYRCTRKKRPFNKRQSIIMCAVLWVLGIPCSVPLALFFTLKESIVHSDHVIVCTLAWPNNDITISYTFIVPTIIVVFIIPMIIISVNYVRVMKTLNDSMNKFQSQGPAKATSSPVNFRINWKLFRKRKEMKIIKFLILLMVLFGIMWMPMSICFIVLSHDKATYNFIMTSEIFMAAECFALSNSLVNPLLYAFINERYRNGLKNMISKVTTKAIQQSQNQVTPVEESSFTSVHNN